MANVKCLRRQLCLIASVVLVFSLLNASIYILFTRRLSNNFGGADGYKMVDVSRYLPHTDGSELESVETDFVLHGELPVLDGAAALVPVYAAVVDTLYPKGSVTYEGGVFSDDNPRGENFANDSKMQYKNTVRGYKAVVDGETDILFCAAPSEEQIQYAKEQGVELVYVPIGLEAFVFFVNRNNPVDGLDAEQVRKIYSGEYTSWSQVGGARRLINPVTRLEGSGSQSAMNGFMGDTSIADKSFFAPFGASIGFSFRYYLDGMVEDEGVKMLSINGVYPSTDNIKNGTYPIVARFYAVYRADNENENVKALIEWLLTEEGQTLIEKNGYVGIH